MTRSSGEQLERLDPKIEKTLSTLRRGKVREQLKMAEEGENIVHKPLEDYATPSLEGATSSIQRSAVDVAQFKIKPTTISMLQQSCQLYGIANEDL